MKIKTPEETKMRNPKVGEMNKCNQNRKIPPKNSKNQWRNENT